jgi:uncharacterized repeat protein (TIGR03803 family)
VFAVDTDGTGFTNLHSFTSNVNFTNSDGANPYASLVLSGNMLYGTARQGGSSGSGTIFRVSTNGSGFTNLHSFARSASERFDVSHAYPTNSDGANPSASLALSGNMLYGTTYEGGTNAAGTIFRINTDGSGFMVLSHFSPMYFSISDNPYNADGAWPYAGLVLSNSTLYGITEQGGADSIGAVFSINTNGSHFTNLYSLGSDLGDDGAFPDAGLVLFGNTLYGTTRYNGPSSGGTAFSLNTDGTGFRNLHSFAANEAPYAGLTLSSNILYGTTEGGGSLGNGTVFALSLAPSAPITTTQPQSQTAQIGNNVTFTVAVSEYPPPNYQWQFNSQNIAGQTAANLSLTNVQFANAGGYLVIVTNTYGSVTSAVAQLTVFTNLVVAQTNEPPPPPGKPTIPTDATHFKVFTNGGFVTGIGLNPSKSTIVLTHGWNDSSTIWPLEMANFIKVELGSSTPNIVAWDWTAVAAEPLPTATLNTQGQGYALGENLTNALGANYSQRIHFIGHSLGTLVNARAANFASIAESVGWGRVPS